MRTNHLDLTGRVAVIFGGTSGLGRTIAIGLAHHGADVIPTGRRRDALADTCAEIRNAARRTMEQTADVQNRDSIRALRDRVLAEFGRIDILVNSAGVTFRKPTAVVTDAEWSCLFETNVTGVLRTCQEFYEPLKASGSGRVINIASVSSFVAFYEVAAYTASKAAVLSLTRSLGIEWARDRISVNAIAPGVFPTALNSKLLDGTERGRELLMRTPAHRFGDPRELIGAAVLLASDGASYITGQSITVDGGFLASGVNS